MASSNSFSTSAVTWRLCQFRIVFHIVLLVFFLGFFVLVPSSFLRVSSAAAIPAATAATTLGAC
jgi:hypothetical protein